MSSRTGSTASGTTACWQVHGAKSTLQRCAYCSGWKPPNKMIRQPLKSSHSHCGTMPGLRRRDAHDRDFQAGTKTTNPSAAPKGRRMTRCTPNRSALIPNRASFREGLRFVSSTRNTENSLAQAVNEAQSVPSKPSIPPHSHLPGPRRPNMTRSNLMLSP